MSQDLDRSLQAATRAEPPAWLDQLVTERVVALVQQQAPLAARSRRAATVARFIRKPWQLLGRLGLELLARTRRAPAGDQPLVQDPHQA